MARTQTLSRPAAPRGTTPYNPFPPNIDMAEAQISATPSPQGFVAMLRAYRSTGGIEQSADLDCLLGTPYVGIRVSLSRLVMSGEIFGFEWRDTFWVPMFQFNLCDMSVRGRPRQVRAVLDREYDRWGLAAWFAQAQPSLSYLCPADAMDMNLPAVLAMARADRREARYN